MYVPRCYYDDQEITNYNEKIMLMKDRLLKFEFSQNRVYGLDILRALAIVLVVFSHGISIYSDEKLKSVMQFFILDGVAIFFVLSGFLIGGIIIRTIEKEPFTTSVLLRFWKRRWFRTLPNYFLILAALVILHNNYDISSIINYIIFIQNFNEPHPAFFDEAWSLSVEEWFYILTPILIFALLKAGIKTRKTILVVIITFIIFSFLVRYYKYYTAEITSWSSWGLHIRKQVLTRLDSVMFGVAGAYLNYYYSALWVRYRKPMIILGIAIYLSNRYFIEFADHLSDGVVLYYSVYSFSLQSLSVMLVLPYLSEHKKGCGVIYRVITIVSIISYSMYLLHFSIVHHYVIPMLGNFLSTRITGIHLELVLYVAYWTFTLFGSILLYKYYEAPFTRMREKSFVS
ncbi:MAG: acyltransferase [Candidatus Thiodiazotropha sp.]|jgi:peptidoglycan/LPS O-acetylase OafA/YrhL